MAAKFVPRPGFDTELNAKPGVIAARLAVAEDIVDDAQDAARETSGAYRSQFRAVRDGNDVRAENTDRAAHLEEYGSINQDAQATLRRAAARHGNLVEKSKRG